MGPRFGLTVHCLNLKKQVTSLHYHAPRLLLGDYETVLCRPIIDPLSQCAFPTELNDYKVAKLLITIFTNAAPYTLFRDLLSHVLVERRSEQHPKFAHLSTLKMGRQSFSKRLFIARKINFDWNGPSLPPH